MEASILRVSQEQPSNQKPTDSRVTDAMRQGWRSSARPCRMRLASRLHIRERFSIILAAVLHRPHKRPLCHRGYHGRHWVLCAQRTRSYAVDRHRLLVVDLLCIRQQIHRLSSGMTISVLSVHTFGRVVRRNEHDQAQTHYRRNAARPDHLTQRVVAEVVSVPPSRTSHRSRYAVRQSDELETQWLTQVPNRNSWKSVSSTYSIISSPPVVVSSHMDTTIMQSPALTATPMPD